MRANRHLQSRSPRRSGKILVMTGLLMPVLVGGVALSVDTGVIGTADAQLKTATDAAALAGARELASVSRFKGTTDISAEITSARSRAIGRGLTNAVLGTPPTIRSEDVSVGYHELNNPGASFFRTDVAHNLYNSVQVKAARTSIPNYFGRIFGNQTTNLSISSTATIENFPVRGFRSDMGMNADILPIVLDKSTYNAMIAGTTTDQYSFYPSLYNPPYDNGVRDGADGFKESKLYPVRDGLPGNWGTIKVGVSNNSTSTLGDQIRYGVTPGEIYNEFSNSQNWLEQSDTSTSPPTPYHHFGGNPGISAGIKDDLASIIGKPVVLPIYDQSGGNGNNAWYRVIAYVGVRIVDVNFGGNPKYVIVQPACVEDPTAVSDTTRTIPWTEGGIVHLHLSR